MAAVAEGTGTARVGAKKIDGTEKEGHRTKKQQVFGFDIPQKHDGQAGGEKDDGGGHVAEGHTASKEKYYNKQT